MVDTPRGYSVRQMEAEGKERRGGRKGEGRGY
jgi:hypothetical protein